METHGSDRGPGRRSVRGTDSPRGPASRDPSDLRPEAGRRLRALAVRVAAACAAAVALLLGVSMAFPDLVARHVVPFFLYHPGHLPAGRSDPAAAGLGSGREVWIRTRDGVRLHAWWVPASPGGAPQARGGPTAGAAPEADTGAGPAAGEACGAVVFFHGNAGTLVQRAFIAQALAGLGYDVLLMDYRGYGLSGGRPSEEGLYRDGEAAYRYLRRRSGREPRRLAVAGHSLGAAVAAHVAAEEPVGAAVLTAAFRSVPRLSRHLYGWLPDPVFRGWSENVFDTRARVERVRAPVMVARGTEDRLVPRPEARGVYQAASSPRRWIEAPGAGHNDLWSHGGFWRELDAFLRSALGCRPDAAGPADSPGEADGDGGPRLPAEGPPEPS